MSDTPNQGSSDASWPSSGSGGSADASGASGSTPPPPPPPTGGGGTGGGGTGGGGGAPTPGGQAKVDLGEAFSFGWKSFQANLGPILIGLIGLFVITAVVGVIWQVIVEGIFGTPGGMFSALLISSIGSFVFTIGGYVIQGMMLRAGFDLVDGRDLETGRLFDASILGPVIVTGLLISIITTIGYILCILPGLIAAIALSLSLHFVVDRGASPTDALRASVELFRANLGQALLLVIVTGIVGFAGVILCGVGLLVSIPVALIAQAYGFRQLTGGVVPAT